jgi:predicted MFS family arabinose efflux permease
VAYVPFLLSMPPWSAFLLAGWFAALTLFCLRQTSPSHPRNRKRAEEARQAFALYSSPPCTPYTVARARRRRLEITMEV